MTRKKEDFLENSHPVSLCLIKKRSFEPLVCFCAELVFVVVFVVVVVVVVAVVGWWWCSVWSCMVCDWFI